MRKLTPVPPIPTRAPEAVDASLDTIAAKLEMLRLDVDEWRKESTNQHRTVVELLGELFDRLPPSAMKDAPAGFVR